MMTLVERATRAHVYHAQNHSQVRYYGVKVFVTAAVFLSLLAPPTHQLPLAITANALWLWLEP